MKIQQQLKKTNFVKVEFVEGKKKIARAFLYLILNDLHSRPYGLMEDVYVEKEYRSQGLGTKLVKEIVKLAKKKKCYKLIATSRLQNEKVHVFYQRLGFKKHGVEFRINF